MEAKNKTQAVKMHLEKYGSITSWEAINFYNATRLSRIIHELRNGNYLMPIQTLPIEHIDSFGNKTTYAKYLFRMNLNES